MFNVLTGLAMGIVIFAITIGVGSVVLTKFGDSTAVCATDQPYSAAYQQCTNASTNTTPTNGAFTNTAALVSDLGTGGLAGWTGAIIALAVGLLFIGALMGKRKY